MTTSVHQAREALGHRLRDIRKDAGLSGRDLATLAGWHSSKVSKIEYGKQTPSEDDIRVWCAHTHAAAHLVDLVATVRNIEAMYVEWKRMLGTGTRRRQQASRSLESRTRLMRWYEPLLLPGILHTAEYAEAVIRRVIDFYDIPDDLDAGVAERMQRQQVLYVGDRRFHFILAEQALRTTVGNQFIIFDDHLVHVETVSAELAIGQPREIALYRKAFDQLARLAVVGNGASGMIQNALNQRRANTEVE